MPLPIKIYSDFVCPFCFLAEFPLKEAARGKDVEIEWMPFELRPYPQPTLRPGGDYLQKAWAHSVYPLARRMGVEIVLPQVSPQPYTHLAWEGFQYARRHGKGNEYNHAVLQAFFQQEQDIGNVEVLTRLARAIGLDPQDFREALEKRRYRGDHQRALHHAYHEAGITSVPTMVIGRKVLTGIQSREHLEKVMEEQLEEQRQQAGSSQSEAEVSTAG